jgi:hypothetical protein
VATIPQSAAKYLDVRQFELGYIAIRGDRALVGATGTLVRATSKVHNEPRSSGLFSTAKFFAVLWADSIALSISPKLSDAPAPCLKLGSRWYLYVPQFQSGIPSGGQALEYGHSRARDEP